MRTGMLRCFTLRMAEHNVAPICTAWPRKAEKDFQDEVLQLNLK